MPRLAGLALLAAALLAALLLVLVRGRRAAPVLGSGRFAVLVAGFVTLLSCHHASQPVAGGALDGSKTAPVDSGAAAPISAPIAAATATASDPLHAHPAFARARDAWLAIPDLPSTGYDEMDKTIATRRAANRVALDELVAAKLVSPAAADVLDGVYAGRLFNFLRARAATCYDPTQLGMDEQLARGDIEDRLTVLAEVERKGGLDPAVAAKARLALERELEITLRISELWKATAGGDYAAHRAEEEALVALFTSKDGGAIEVSDKVVLRPGIEEAMRVIQAFYTP